MKIEKEKKRRGPLSRPGQRWAWWADRGSRELGLFVSFVAMTKEIAPAAMSRLQDVNNHYRKLN
ncbi:hypothetical protein [Mucilaginibacter lacusdianchii]|uniref:hypothetical protein n=1 Tax=Mucilaginibacter lacusdianchii TaxID=2684211 RepID=UPI00131AD835|nr:hypothetical protein [Mucilaginibacter sp. JXJ CY 39]